MNEYRVIGLMSGTSLDGLDIAACRFGLDDGKWEYEILKAVTIPYTHDWSDMLSGLPHATALEFVSADHAYGHLLGKLSREFIQKHSLAVDFIASHGHTIFHRPDQGFTAQIGNGAAIRAEAGLPVICDFRSGDVADGGQGAPLVPAGDRLLFPTYDYCLNLGGFANISFELAGSRMAFDICPVNIVLNLLAQREGQAYDRDGSIAASGRVDESLLESLDRLPFYSQAGPRSLGREWVDSNVLPRLDAAGLSTADLLATFSMHAARQIALQTGCDNNKNILVTGGGAHNSHLISLIRSLVSPGVVIPDQLTVNYKEALIFAFLGVLRWRNEINCLKTVTGAQHDNCCGANY